jgi:hypothetical protein
MDLFVDGEKKLSQNFTNTGGWQVWQTFHNTISLESGRHKMRLVATSPGFNINWIEAGGIISGIQEKREAIPVIYPNPAKDRIYLENTGNAARIEVVNITGQVVLQSPVTRILDISSLPDGYYILKYISENNEVNFHGTFIKRNT